MATSGTIDGGSTTTYGDVIASRITWTRTATDTAKNTSTITVALYYKKKDSATTYGTGSWKLTVNGTAYTGSSYAEIKSSGYTKVFEKTGIVISHNADGSKSFSVNASGSYIPGTSFTNTNCSGTVTLDAIPRASTFNSVTSSVALGGTAKLSITAKSSYFYHKATWTCGSTTATQNLGRAGSTNAKEYTYTIPTGWANQITTATSKSCSVSVQTYSDSGYKTAVGSAVSKTFTVTVPDTADYKPTVSLAAVLGNKIAAIGDFYVQGKTSVTLNATGAGKGSASIKSYTFKRGTATIKTNTVTTTTSSASETTNTTGSVTYSVTITDSRGRTATASQTITVYEYKKPSITVDESYRCDSTGKEDRTNGTYIHLKATLTYSSVNSKNSLTARNAKYRENGSTGSYSAATNLTSGTAATIGGGNIATGKTYEVLITLTDAVGETSTVSVVIPTSYVTMDFKAGGTGVAIGKIADTDYLLDLGVNVRVDGTGTDNIGSHVDLKSPNRELRLNANENDNVGLLDLTNNKQWMLVSYNSDPKVLTFPQGYIDVGATDITDHAIQVREKGNSRDISLHVSTAKNAGIFDHGDNTWIIRSDSSKNVYIPHPLNTMKNFSVGDSSTNETHDISIVHTTRKLSFTLNTSGHGGFYDSTAGKWAIDIDTNQDVKITNGALSVPNGRFTAPKSIVTGSVTITPSAANTPTGKAVTWTEMAGVPKVTVTPVTGVPGTQVTGVGIASIEKTGCTIYLTRTNTSNTGVHYIAIY